MEKTDPTMTTLHKAQKILLETWGYGLWRAHIQSHLCLQSERTGTGKVHAQTRKRKWWDSMEGLFPTQSYTEAWGLYVLAKLLCPPRPICRKKYQPKEEKFCILICMFICCMWVYMDMHVSMCLYIHRIFLDELRRKSAFHYLAFCSFLFIFLPCVCISYSENELMDKIKYFFF